MKFKTLANPVPIAERMAEYERKKQEGSTPSTLEDKCRKLYKDFLSYGYEPEIGQQIVDIGKFLNANNSSS